MAEDDLIFEDDGTFEGFDNEDEPEEEEEITEPVISPKFSDKTLQIVIDPIGRVVMGDEVDAYKFWVIKCLLTERYKYLAYDTDFGTGLHEIIGAQYERDVAESEIEREITEALEVDERTMSVEDFSFEWHGESVRVNFTVENIYGEAYIDLQTGGENIGGVSFSST